MKTPLYDTHISLGAKMTSFGGWDMPIQYSSIIEEHLATREKAGLFDVSHMGEIAVKGSGAIAALNKLITGDLTKLRQNRIRYAFLTNDRGGVVDDLVVYKLGEDDLLLIVNAANTDKDFDWIKTRIAAIDSAVTVENLSKDYGQIAIQGPLAQAILQKLTDYDLSEIRYFAFDVFPVCGHVAIVSRSGYTGEDGFEVYCESEHTKDIWDRLMAAGQEQGLLPAGLGARDTLRFESALPLYGHELTEDISPIEAGQGVFVKLDKDDYTGSAILAAQVSEGVNRHLVGIELTDKGIPREGYTIEKDGISIGFITSGMYSPTFKKGLAMALVSTDSGEPGSVVDVDIRGKKVGAKIISLPFYKKRAGGK